VFLDRDGVLVRSFVRGGKPYPATTVAELDVLPGVVEACRTLREQGLLTIVVTNQPDVARGTVTMNEVDELNVALAAIIPLDEVVVCPHDDRHMCRCRKPQPGLLLSAAARHGIDVGTSVMVGDRWRDVEAGRRAGCRTVFVDRGYDERRPNCPDLVVNEFPASVAWILESCVTVIGEDARRRP
jgi:D-glycero-D-manno-heptose 1,7-bisphosphate phosphatase